MTAGLATSVPAPNGLPVPGPIVTGTTETKDTASK